MFLGSLKGRGQFPSIEQNIGSDLELVGPVASTTGIWYSFGMTFLDFCQQRFFVVVKSPLLRVF
jgi:hypothetical protein